MTKRLWLVWRTPDEFRIFFTRTYGNGEAADDVAYGRMCLRASPVRAHRGTGADAELPLSRLSARERIGLCCHPHRSGGRPAVERRIALPRRRVGTKHADRARLLCHLRQPGRWQTQHAVRRRVPPGRQSRRPVDVQSTDEHLDAKCATLAPPRSEAAVVRDPRGLSDDRGSLSRAASALTRLRCPKI